MDHEREASEMELRHKFQTTLLDIRGSMEKIVKDFENERFRVLKENEERFSNKYY